MQPLDPQGSRPATLSFIFQHSCHFLGDMLCNSWSEPCPTPIKKKYIYMHISFWNDFAFPEELKDTFCYLLWTITSTSPPWQQRPCSFCLLLEHQRLEHSAWHTPDSNIHGRPCMSAACIKTLSQKKTHHLKAHSVSCFISPGCILSLLKTEIKK